MRLLATTVVLAVAGGLARGQVPPSETEISGYTGLHRAAHLGDVGAIRRLASEGADLEARDGAGRTPIHVAAFASQDQAIRALAAAGADMNALEAQAYDAVTIAAVADDPDLMSLAISLGNDPGLTTSPYEGTALIAAAHLGHVEIVRGLVTAGAPLDHVNNLGWTALIEAVILGDGGPDHQTVVDVLITAGANPEIADPHGVTALQHAEARGFTEIVRRIRAAGD